MRMAINKPRMKTQLESPSQPSEGAHPKGIFILDLQDHGTIRFCCLTHPLGSTQSQKPQETNPPGSQNSRLMFEPCVHLHVHGPSGVDTGEKT